MNCPKCGNELNPNMKFCAKCGTTVVPAQPPKEYAEPKPVEPQKPTKQKKGKKNLVLATVAIVLVLAVFFAGVFLSDMVMFNNEAEKEGYITDFPVIKHNTDLLVYDAEKFPYESYNIRVDKLSNGKVFKSSAFNKYENIINEKSDGPIYSLKFKEDGKYQIRLEGITSERTQNFYDTTTQNEELIVIVIIVEVDDDDKNAVDKVTVDSKEDDVPIKDFSEVILSDNESKVNVPDFIGLEYSEDFKARYSQFVFKVTEEEADPSYKPNTIISQTPAAGEKIDSEKQVIEIVVAAGEEFVTIPSDLEGKDFVTVKSALINLDLKIVEREVEYTEDYEEKGIYPGTVIDVTPAPGCKVYAGSSVTIRYLSYSSNSVSVVAVPDVIGKHMDTAKTMLESNGFIVKIEYDYDDTVNEDCVIKSSVNKGIKIPKGSEIILTISLGEGVERSTQINMTLPDLGEYGTIKASLDGVNILTVDNHYIDGSSYSFYVKGDKPDSVLKVFINSRVVYKCDLDFTKHPVEITNISSFAYIDETTAPYSAN